MVLKKAFINFPEIKVISVFFLTAGIGICTGWTFSFELPHRHLLENGFHGVLVLIRGGFIF